MILLNKVRTRQKPAQFQRVQLGAYATPAQPGMVVHMATTLSRSFAWFSQNRYPSPCVRFDHPMVKPDTFFLHAQWRMSAYGAKTKKIPFVFRALPLYSAQEQPKQKTKKRGKTPCELSTSLSAHWPPSRWPGANGMTLNAPAQGPLVGLQSPQLPAAMSLLARLSALVSVHYATMLTWTFATKPSRENLKFWAIQARGVWVAFSMPNRMPN